MHADRDADAVRARRERLLRTLAHQAGLDPAQCPSMHPPRTRAEQEAMRRAAQAVSPQAEPPHLREAVEALGRRHAESRALVRALRDVADRAQHEACGGEDPLTPETRAVLEQAEAQLQEFAEDWQRWAPLLVVEDWVPLGDWPAGERLPPAWPEVPLPDAPPELYPRLYERLWAMMTTEAL